MIPRIPRWQYKPNHILTAVTPTWKLSHTSQHIIIYLILYVFIFSDISFNPRYCECPITFYLNYTHTCYTTQCVCTHIQLQNPEPQGCRRTERAEECRRRYLDVHWSRHRVVPSRTHQGMNPQYHIVCYANIFCMRYTVMSVCCNLPWTPWQLCSLCFQLKRTEAERQWSGQAWLSETQTTNTLQTTPLANEFQLKHWIHSWL